VTIKKKGVTIKNLEGEGLDLYLRGSKLDLKSGGKLVADK
jgi:hypothetical protein